jgi:DNA replication protein DnaC
LAGRARLVAAPSWHDDEHRTRVEMNMLLEQTMEKLTGMRLLGMAKGLRQWCDGPRGDSALAPEDLVGILADAEWIWRENNKLTQRLRTAKLKEPTACIEDISYKYPRGLAKAVINELASSRWVATQRNVIISGPTGVGKSYIACALGNKACRDGHGVLFRRTSRLLDELGQARADGTLPLVLKRLAKTEVLILDDFGSHALSATERRHLIEVLEDRYGVSSTIVTSQLEPSDWHAVIGDQTVADGVCDRLVHNAHRIKLSGESVRKLKEKKEELTGETKFAK